MKISFLYPFYRKSTHRHQDDACFFWRNSPSAEEILLCKVEERQISFHLRHYAEDFIVQGTISLTFLFKNIAFSFFYDIIKS